MTPSMLHAEGYCANDCMHPEHDVEYTVTVNVTLRAHDDETAIDLVTEVLEDAFGIEDVKVVVVTAHG